MENGATDPSRPSGQRPGPPRGGRAVVVPEDGGPPAAWAPAVLIAHLAVLGLGILAAAVVALSGVPRSGDVPRWTTSPVVEPAIWVIAVATVVLVIRAVGTRRPGVLAYWLIGTAAWVVAPLAWLFVASSAEDPLSVGYYVLVLPLSPYVWLLLSPALLIGAGWTAVLTRSTS